MLTISLSAENLDSGSPEEAATFGLLAIAANDRLLTAGEDTERRELRHGPYVSGYPLAEWLAWNWWRIRWECAPASAGEWSCAHRMSTVGDGYAWPDIAMFSDGRRVFLRSEPTREAGAVLFRYIGAARPESVPAGNFEAAIDEFLTDIMARLDGYTRRNTNLHRLWSDLEAERADPALARFRRFEARLGRDPDEIDETEVHRRLADADVLGEEALGEVAADTASRGAAPEAMMSAADFAVAAERSGFDSNPEDAATPPVVSDAPTPASAVAWRVGEDMARRLRDRERLNGEPVSDARLAELAGTTEKAISSHNRCVRDMAFALRRDGARERIALRSKRKTGRRFELARLVGDRLYTAMTCRTAENLFPATRAYSYRQKVQRAFAAELNSPFAAVYDMLNGDYSEDNQRRAALRFDVSERTIRTELVNHRVIPRDEAPDIVDRGP